MTADKLFNKLGYKKQKSNIRHIYYYNPMTKYLIRFDKIAKEINVEEAECLNVYEIIAIYKKIEELGWIE